KVLTVTDFGGRWYNRFSCSGEESVSELELVAGKQVERADFSSADNRSVRPPLTLRSREKPSRKPAEACFLGVSLVAPQNQWRPVFSLTSGARPCQAATSSLSASS